MSALRALALLCVGLIGCDGCGGCGGNDPVAQLTTFEPGVDRDFKRAVKQWQPAQKGDEFNVGDGLRTGPKATAELQLFPDGRMKVQPGAVVRFVDSPPGDKTQRLAIEGGDVEIESGGLDIGVDTAFGLTRLKRGSRLRVGGEGSDRRLHLDVGAADIAGSDGTRSLSAGDSLKLEGGVAVIEIEAPPPEPQPVDQEAQEPTAATPAPLDAGLSEAELSEAEEKAYGRFDEPAGTPMVQLTAGESATIHDPQTPTNIRVSLDGCPTGGVVELAQSGDRFRYYRARGEGSAVVRAQAGSYRYRVRCIEGDKLQRRPVKQGRLKIVKDSARQRLPRKVPSVTIDADGRRYSVRYSNILPTLTVRWRRAPSGAKQTLNWKTGASSQRFASSEAGVQFKSGQVSEGTHTFFFEAGGTKSKTGTLDVVFDSTARAAYLTAPADGEVAMGQRVRIAGGVLPDSRVSVDGVDIPVKGGRFALDATAPADRSAFAIRVQHKSAGTHYYLRHLKP